MELYIKIVEAADVPKTDTVGKSDPYIVIDVSNSAQKLKTKVCKDTLTPVWNEEFRIPITSEMSEVVTLTMMDKDVASDDEISTLKIAVGKLPRGKANDSWYNMYPAKKIKNGGKLRVVFHLTESK